HLGFIIRNMNGYGNNVFIDNVNITTVYKRDLELVSINAPNATICNGSLTPAVTVKNIGMETITGFKLSYTIDNGALFTTNLNSLSFAPGSQMNVSLNAFNVA